MKGDSRRACLSALVCAVLAGHAPLALAQVCAGAWLPGSGVPGVDGVVSATLRLPNGDVIVGGRFAIAGSIAVKNIARYRPSTGEWSSLGFGFDGQVLALARLRNGDIIAGGGFTHSGSAETPRVARWDGSGWAPLGTGFNASVNALAVMPNGDLLAGGLFTQTLLGAYMQAVARWNGSSWTWLGSLSPTNFLPAEVESLLVLPNGDVIAGGTFSGATQGGTYDRIARWNGSAWSQLGTGIGGPAGSGVHTLARLANGDVVAAGDFASAGSVSATGVAVWNGASWASMGAGVGGSIHTLFVRASGQLVAGGELLDPANVPFVLASWNGASWSAFASSIETPPFNFVNTIAEVSSSELLVGGVGTQANAARWNEVTGHWSTTSAAGFSDAILALATLPNGDIVAGGTFTTVGSVSASHIAHWNGTAWLPLGSGLNGFVYALAVLPGGQLVAGGQFTAAGGVSVSNVAAWNGTT
jgi:hypothetical protein